MKRTDTIVIGGGQAGLAMSHCLWRRGIDHVVLERGQVGQRWRSERWDSLRLLTPNWLSELPGWRYRGDDPDGYMTMAEVVDSLDAYARSFGAPVEGGTEVLALERSGPGKAAGYRVTTSNGTWTARSVVIATGHCGRPLVPAIARDLAGDVCQLVPTRYRNPDALPTGGVLVVGASASGVQIAAELQRAGRQVTLAVGRHTRLPRRYRGRDIFYWLLRIGLLDQRAEEVSDLEAARAQPSLQLVGSPDQRSLDLAALAEQGVRLVGRALAAEGHRMRFARDLGATTAAADDKLARLLDRIDAHAGPAPATSSDKEGRPAPFVPAPAPDAVDLRADGIRTVLWATGFAPSYPWLEVPVVDRRGELVHRGGVTPAPGLYALGLRFMRRRKSNFLGGVGDDAEELADHIVASSSRGRVAA